ncbi:AAA family ATPase [Roseinatronobacter sp. NSM]|uniref:AAA family ATPase n=1 Tax=Roseinatronobacter sp. NSM TaxID=3457785 RepID=UPI00403501E8
MPATPHPLSDINTHPGFAIAQDWYNRHKPGLPEAPGATAELPPMSGGGVLEKFLGDRSSVRVPRKTLPLDLVLILTLARAIARGGVDRLGAPAQLCLVHGWAAAMSPLQDLLLHSALERAFLHTTPERPKILQLEGGAPGSRGQGERRRTLAQQITKALICGRGMVVLNAAPADVTDELRRLCARDLHLPRPDRAMVMALLALLFPTARDKLMLDALPSDEALARLTPLELTSALHARGIRDALAALHRLSAPVLHAAQPGDLRGLDAIAGQADAVAMLRRLAVDIDRWRAGGLAWSAVPRSMIFHGPPGTGKSMMAQAFAAETGLPLIATSYAECQKFGHQGDMLAALDHAVAEAVARAPAIFFLDELDGFNARTGAGSNRNESYIRAVITGLLRQLDRLMATDGVVLIGATNDLPAIDPAIQREGRFDSKLSITAPDRAALAQILHHHLGSTDAPDLTTAVARAAARLVGTSGAAAAALARAARARQRETNGPLAEGLLAELEIHHPAMPATEQRRIALHEAGHVIVGLLSDMAVPTAVRLTPDGGVVHWPTIAFHTRASALAELRMLLAGRAAEQVFLGAPSSSAGVGPDSDLAQATLLARQIETEWGMGDGGLIWHPGMPVSLQHMSWLPQKLDHLIATAESQARAIISKHRGTVDALAQDLLDAHDMTGAQLAAWVARLRELNAKTAPESLPDGVIPFEPG